MKKPIETEPEPEIKIAPLSGKINPIKKFIAIIYRILRVSSCIVQLTGQNLESHRVKRRKARILNFEGLE